MSQVNIAFPSTGETLTSSSFSVDGSLTPAPGEGETVRVTVNFTLTSYLGGPAPASQYVDTDQEFWTIPFNGVNNGTYTITASANGYNPSSVANVTVDA
jgi:hypothetical protein